MLDILHEFYRSYITQKSYTLHCKSLIDGRIFKLCYKYGMVKKKDFYFSKVIPVILDDRLTSVLVLYHTITTFNDPTREAF